MQTNPGERQRNLRAEYQIADRLNDHLDNLNWQIGSILIGGSLAAVALATTANSKGLELTAICAASASAILTWWFLVRRNRGMAEIARMRMRMIEYELGTAVHSLLSQGTETGYVQVWFKSIRIPGPRGFRIVSIMAFGISSSFILLAIYRVLQYVSLVK